MKQNWRFLKNIFAGPELSYFLFSSAKIFTIFLSGPETLKSGLILIFLGSTGVYGDTPWSIRGPIGPQEKISAHPRIAAHFGPGSHSGAVPCAKGYNVIPLSPDLNVSGSDKNS